MFVVRERFVKGGRSRAARPERPVEMNPEGSLRAVLDTDVPAGAFIRPKGAPARMQDQTLRDGPPVAGSPMMEE